MDNLIEVPNLEGFKDYKGKEYKHGETVVGRETAAREASRQRLKEMRNQTQPTVDISEKLLQEDIKEEEIKRPQIINDLVSGINELNGIQHFTKEKREAILLQAGDYLKKRTPLGYKGVENIRVLLAAALAGSNTETVELLIPEVKTGKVPDLDRLEISQAIFETNRRLLESPLAEKSDLGRHAFVENLRVFIACAIGGTRNETILSLAGDIKELEGLTTADQKTVNQLIAQASNNLIKGPMGQDFQGGQTYKYVESLRTLVGIALTSRI